MTIKRTGWMCQNDDRRGRVDVKMAWWMCQMTIKMAGWMWHNDDKKGMVDVPM